MSDAAAASLPNDVIFDILSRTPVRSVCRFRCVSRGWRALITSDPAFHAAHRSRHTDPFLVDTGNFRRGSQPCIRIRDMDGNVVRVIEGVGGLGMRSTTSLDDLVCVHSDSDQDGVHVVDPATGEVLATSPAREVLTDDDGTVTRLYYPCFAIGRAGAAPSDAYKMVRLSRAGATCDVLTIGDLTARWRKARAHPFPNYAPDTFAPPVAINGISCTS
ncbi:putative F-box protein At1g12855 [Aegilops tauschii subsp. strangulata]|uniref:Uncharacterized protein n=1 Tax=Aegilops tauschii TaxID=37682 RepID=R7WBW3_AEGTA